MTSQESGTWRWLLLPLVVVSLSCIGGDTDTYTSPSQRLIDVFEPAWLEGSSELPTSVIPRTEWLFDDDSSQSENGLTHGWEPITGVSDLKITDGKLVGRSTSGLPLLRLERTAGRNHGDPLHEIKIRMKTSSGAGVYMHFIGGEEDEFDRAVAESKEAFWLISAPLESGSGGMHEYTLTSPWPVRSNDIHQIFLRPVDQSGARFEIDSIRLVFRREYLAKKSSGIGWEGLSDIYRESVVTRAPEKIRWSLTLPERPLLDLAVGTPEEHPVTFRISLRSSREKDTLELLKRTITTPSRWEPVTLALDDYASEEVTLLLELESGRAGTIGLWGAPAVRNQLEANVSQRSVRGEKVKPQGVIFILADTLRPDRLEFYGHTRTTMPNFHKLVREGTVFLDAQAQGTWTKTSTASLFTSLYPSTNGVLQFPDRLPNAALTLAEAYRKAGYATLGFSSVLFTGKYSNLHQGYEVLHETTDPGQSETAQLFVDRLLPWLEEHRHTKFFVLLHVFDPHSPYEPVPPYNEIWADPAWHGEHRRNKRRVQEFIKDPMRRIISMPTNEEVREAGLDPEEFIEREYAWYDGSIRTMDQELGRLFERLEELGLDERTLTVFTSDHGDEFHDHERMSHGHSVYGELTHVPLVFHYPGVVAAGKSVAETVQLIDVMPTLLDISLLSKPKELQGQTLLSLLSTSAMNSEDLAEWRPRPAVSERPPTPIPNIPPLPGKKSTALIFDGWKLIENLEPREGASLYELYDHKNDPLDSVNLAEEEEEVVKRLAAMLKDWRKDAEAARLASDAEMEQTLGEDELKRLRALGYVE